MGVEDFGIYTAALGYATLFSTFTNIGVNTALVRAINVNNDKEKEKEKENFTSVVVIKSFLGLFVYVIMCLSLLFTGYSGDIIYLILLFGVVRISNEYQSVFYAFFDAKEKFSTSAYFRMLFSLSFISGTVLVVLFKGNYFDFVYIRIVVVLFFIVLMAVVTFKQICPATIKTDH